MKDEPTKEESLKAKARKISIKEGAIYSISEGIGMRYITPYAIAFGANNTQIGFLNSLPQFLGSLSQIYTIKLMPKHTRKKLTFYATLFQSFMWLVLISLGIIPFILNISAPITSNMLIIIYTILIIFGSSVVPAWTSWMRDIIPEESPGHYFGIRNRICGFLVLLSMLLGGFILDYFKQTNLFIGFIIIFTIAFISRFTSSFLFLKKYEPEFKPNAEEYFTISQFLKKMPKTNYGNFVIYISLMAFATNISAPFFTVYMLKDLHFSYITYILITMSSAFSNLLFMPVWGKFADHYGNKKVLSICGFFVPLVPLLWLASPIIQHNSQNILVQYLIIIELFAGFAWAGFNLSASNFIYAAVSRQKLAICVAYFHIIETAGILIGAVIGGYISTLPFHILNLSSILFVFLLSGIARLIVTLLMIRKFKEVQHVKNFGINEAWEIFSNLSPTGILKILK